MSRGRLGDGRLGIGARIGALGLTRTPNRSASNPESGCIGPHIEPHTRLGIEPRIRLSVELCSESFTALPPNHAMRFAPARYTRIGIICIEICG